MDKTRPDDHKSIANEFMALARKESGQEAIKSFGEFIAKWGAKYKAIKKWGDGMDLKTIFNFYRFPRELRSKLYSNNRIESFNREIRRQAKAHVQFCTQDAEEKFLVSLFNRYNFKVGARPIRGREYIEDELIEL